MASLDTNRLLPVIAGTVVLLAGGGVFLAAQSGDDTRESVEAAGEIRVRAPKPADADDTTDTIRALSGHVTDLKQRVLSATERAEQLASEKAALEDAAAAQAQAIEAKVDARIQALTEQHTQTTTALLEEIQRMQATIETLGESLAASSSPEPSTPSSSESASASEFSLDLAGSEILPGLGLDAIAGSGVIEGLDLLDVVWINPLDRKGAPPPGGVGEGGTTSELDDLFQRHVPSASSYREDAGLLEVHASNVSPSVATSASHTPSVDPPITKRFFTIPDLSVLTGATALTSLVGRVYLDNEITDPWPFKVMIGRDNLGANYSDLPVELDGMLYEGYAIGEWTLGCVRGWITAATFVFEDGVTVSAYASSDGARPAESRFSDTAIGYISDAYGNPCVAGTQTTDAPTFLASRATAAGLAGYARALNAESELRRSSVGPDGTISTVTSVIEGSRDYAANAAFAEAFAEGARWIRERQRQSFDAVYVPPGSPVTVNLQTELWLDKKPGARQVRFSRDRSDVHATLD